MSSEKTSIYFASKRDWWLSALLGALVVVQVAMVATAPFTARVADWSYVLILVPSIVLVLWIWLRTGYTLTGTLLLVRCGPFRWRIALAAVESVKRTHNPLSSPALSLDRLAIVYGRRSLMISPDNADEFSRN
jgi:hypothetical protein